MRTEITFGIAMMLASTVGFAQSQGYESQGQGNQQMNQQQGNQKMNKKMFQKWDQNNNGQLSRQEFMQGAQQAGWINLWDQNNNNRVNRNEFGQAGFQGDFGAWDQNNSGNLDENELYTGIYDTYDEDENGHWTWGEWDDAGDAGFWDL